MRDSINFDISGLSDFQVVGRGGFATVYSAHEAAFNRRVGVKLFDALDEAGLRRFAREQASMGSVHEHPNIVTPFSSGFTNPDGRPYLVMEYMAGGSLQQRLEREGPLPPAEAIGLILPIAHALGHAHRAGVLHHDVKPGNLLLSGAGVVKLSDFGIAAVLDTTATASVGYSLAYTPPETFDHEGVADVRDERSDLYSLGSTLYALITGSPPFESRTNRSAASLMARILTQPVPTIGIPALDSFFATALAKDRRQRFQSASQFIQGLTAVALAVPPATSTAPPTPPPPWTPTDPRSTRVATASPHTDSPPPTAADRTRHAGAGDLHSAPTQAAGFIGTVSDGRAGGGEHTGSGQPGLVPGVAAPLLRLAARVIDLVVWLAIGAAANRLGGGIRGITLWALGLVAYEAITTAVLGGTVGKRLLGLSVSGRSFRPSDPVTAVGRALALVGPFYPLWVANLLPAFISAPMRLAALVYVFVNLVLVFTGAQREAVWDLVARTWVVRRSPS